MLSSITAYFNGRNLRLTRVHESQIKINSYKNKNILLSAMLKEKINYGQFTNIINKGQKTRGSPNRQAAYNFSLLNIYCCIFTQNNKPMPPAPPLSVEQ